MHDAAQLAVQLQQLCGARLHHTELAAHTGACSALGQQGSQ
jgi:hypothetical protein